jgi:hypothetical protein
MDMLALDPQRLAAGHEEMDLRRFTEETFGCCSGGRNHMFTAIEEKQEAMAANEGEETSHRIPRLDRGVKTER